MTFPPFRTLKYYWCKAHRRAEVFTPRLLSDPEGNTWVGPFDTKEEAEAKGEELSGL